MPPGTCSTRWGASRASSTTSPTITCSDGWWRRVAGASSSRRSSSNDRRRADFRTLVGHELRWARTIRSVRPVGYLMSFVTFGLPLSLLALACAGATPAAVAALAANLVARLAGWHVTRRTAGIPRLPDACLLPLRDVLSAAIWILSFCGAPCGGTDNPSRSTTGPPAEGHP